MPIGTGAQRAVGYSQPENRQKDDFYETPALAIEELLKREKFPGPIWEPASGAGAISKILEKYGYEVVSSDIREDTYGKYPGVDFLQNSIPAFYPKSIITNPPFKLALPFILRALEEPSVEKIAMFARIQLLESQERYNALWSKFPPKRVYIFSKRVTCSAEGVSIMAFSWYLWEKGFTGTPELHWILPEK
jgi:hypothetical protein